MFKTLYLYILLTLLFIIYRICQNRIVNIIHLRNIYVTYMQSIHNVYNCYPPELCIIRLCRTMQSLYA